MLPAYPLILASASSDGAALTGTVTATSIMPSSAIATIPAGALQIGSMVKITLRGRITTIVTTPGTLTLDLRLGGVVVSAFGAISLNVTAQTNATWSAELIATVRSTGAGMAASALCTGQFSSRAIIGSGAAGTTGVYTQLLPETAPAVGTFFDSTVAVPVNVFATWSIAQASSIQIHQALVELKV